MDAARSSLRESPLRVALVADLLEERWPSMNLVAEELFSHLKTPPFEHRISVEFLRPALKNRGRGIGRFVNRFWDYPRWLRRKANAFDVFHIIDHSYAHLVHVLPAARTVVTCHDVDAFICVEADVAISGKVDRNEVGNRAACRKVEV